MPSSSASGQEDTFSPAPLGSSAPSSPPVEMEDDFVADERLVAEESKARERNISLEKKRQASLKKKKRAVSKEDREKKARELDDLLRKSAAFSDILTKKTQVLGRVGTALDGKALGEHDLQMASQPECLVGGKMRDYQLEGITWMYEVCVQGMSGILADEMGLGKSHLKCPQLCLISLRENDSNHWHHRPAPRTGELPGTALDHRAIEYTIKLDRRVQ